MANQYVLASGLQIPTVEELLEDVTTEQRQRIDPLLDTSAESPTGQFNGIILSHLRELWEVAEIAFNFGPEAEGHQLENVAAITGTRRQEATPSRFGGTHRLLVNLDPGATIPGDGTAVAHVDGQPSVRFKMVEEVTNPGGSAATFPIAAESEELGPIVANAGTLTVIATPIVGWNSVTNPYDAELGLAQDNDSALRARRERELRATGSGTVDSLRSDLLDLEVDGAKPILEAQVIENVNDSFDFVTGLPPHSLEAIIYDGIAAGTDNDLIAQVIWDSKPGGIEAVGNTSGVAVDALGVSRTVPFSRPTIEDVGIEIDIEIDVAAYAGDLALKQKLVDTMTAVQKPGQIVRWSVYVGAALTVPGVTAVNAIAIGFAGDPIVPNTDLIMGLRQQPTTSTAGIEVEGT